MIYHRNTRPGKGVQNRYIQLDKRTIFPQVAIRTSVQTHFFRNDGQKVVTIDITQIARSNLSTHVPAIKRRSGIGYSPNFEAHIGDYRKRMPLEVQLSKPRIVWMTERNLENNLTW